MSGSVEAFYRGVLAGGIFGLVFPAEGAGLLVRLASPFKPALLAGSWCFLTSLASCELTRRGCGFPWNGAVSGLFSGYVIGAASRWPRDSIAWTMAASSALSLLQHYGLEGQPKEGGTYNDGSGCGHGCVSPSGLPRSTATCATAAHAPASASRPQEEEAALSRGLDGGRRSS